MTQKQFMSNDEQTRVALDHMRLLAENAKLAERVRVLTEALDQLLLSTLNRCVTFGDCQQARSALRAKEEA